MTFRLNKVNEHRRAAHECELQPCAALIIISERCRDSAWSDRSGAEEVEKWKRGVLFS